MNARGDGRRNGGGGVTTVERGGPRRRRGPRGSGNRGSADERGSALPRERARATSGEGVAPFNAKYRDPANGIGGRLVNASAQPPSRRRRHNHPIGTDPPTPPLCAQRRKSIDNQKYGQRNVTRSVPLDSPHHAESTDTERVPFRGLYAAQRLLLSVHFLPID
ncbi:hypothetical protein niasHT_038708 [Heterodera trifolii]|uniref:Uncharacterized protein n=1 Tax=Heterodera trifolii TaxID=157864 RepID=A0ABD2I2K8_9BILA